MLTIPPGVRAKARKHATHETAIYQMTDRSVMCRGERLRNRKKAETGDLIYTPADTSHRPFTPSLGPCRAIFARTDPNEQESVVLLPDLEHLVT
jgi:uncharacterized RmlC-like cupin family protein